MQKTLLHVQSKYVSSRVSRCLLIGSPESTTFRCTTISISVSLMVVQNLRTTPGLPPDNPGLPPDYLRTTSGLPPDYLRTTSGLPGLSPDDPRTTSGLPPDYPRTTSGLPGLPPDYLPLQAVVKTPFFPKPIKGRRQCRSGSSRSELEESTSPAVKIVLL